MKNKKNVPDIRFKGFDEEWKENYLHEVINLKSGKDYKHLSGGNIPVYGTGGFMLNVNEALSYNCNGIGIGRKGTIDKPYILYAPFWTVDTLFYALPKDNNDLDFIFDIFQKIDWRSKDESTGVPSLSKVAINSTKICTTEFIEQHAIGNYFQNIDRLINTSQTKLDKLKNIKKACLEKMFPRNGSTTPELRFKGFTEEWKEIRLGDTNTYFTDGNYGTAYPKPSDITDSSNGVPFLRGSNICNGRLNERNANYITPSKHLELSSGHLQEDDIVITVRGSLGALGYVDQGCVNWNINSQLAIIRTDKNELIGSFLIQHLLSGKGQCIIISKISGSALKQLPIGQLKDVSTPITEVDEQITIGKFFTNLDDLIAKTEQQINKLKNIKKACLDKMFVNMEDKI